MNDRIRAGVNEFLSRYPMAEIVDAVIDTSVDKNNHGNIVPYLNLSVLNVLQGKSFIEAMQHVAKTGDWGFFYDITDEKGVSCFKIELIDLYPDWPDDCEAGDKKVILILRDALNNLSNKTIGMFHHVDAWPAIDIRTGGSINV